MDGIAGVVRAGSIVIRGHSLTVGAKEFPVLAFNRCMQSILRMPGILPHTGGTVKQNRS